MPQRIIILTDIPDWCAGTVSSLQQYGWEVEVLELDCFSWAASDPLPEWSIVFNRIASRPACDSFAALKLARDLLEAIQQSGIPCLNGSACHTIGASKALQASLFARLGVPTPWTQVVSADSLESCLAAVDGQMPLLIKPNAGGKGRGISSPEEVGSASFLPDGLAVLQERIESGDGLIHRVEMIGREILYEADAPLIEDQFDYCLAGIEPTSLGFRLGPSSEIASHCRRIAEAASMDVGSVEYLVDQSGQPQFIDMNPVSSYLPDAVDRLGFDPVEKLDALLRLRIEGAE